MTAAMSIITAIALVFIMLDVLLIYS